MKVSDISSQLSFENFVLVVPFIEQSFNIPVSRLTIPFQTTSSMNLLELIETIIKATSSSLTLVFLLPSEVVSFSRLKFQMHLAYSKCQSICTLLDKLLLNISVLYYPICSVDFLNQSECLKLAFDTNKILQPTNLINFSSTNSFDTLKIVAVGGTFDHLHSGHKILLSIAALLSSKELLIGLVEESLLVTKQFSKLIQPYEQRKERICNFINQFKPALSFSIYPLSDIYGPTIVRDEIEALVVSKETLPGAYKGTSIVNYLILL